MAAVTICSDLEPPKMKSDTVSSWEGLWAGGEGATEDEMAGWHH